MGYYMGDYYRGYRGDPGFWSFLKGAARSAVGMIPVVGPAASSVLASVGAGKATSAITKVVQHPAVKAATEVIQRGVSVAGKHPALTAAGVAGVAGVGTMIAKRGSAAAAGMAAQPGVRMRGGRHKRMNVCNPRALRRAIRRTHGFAKLAMKTIHLVHPKKHYTFGGFKRVKHAPKKRR